MTSRSSPPPDGALLRVSGTARTTRSIDLAAARIWGPIRALAATGLLVAADWRIMRKPRCCPYRAGRIAKAQLHETASP